MAPGRMFRKWDFRRDKTKKNEQARYIAPSATQALSGLSPFNSLPVSSAKGNSITLYAGNFFRVAVWVLQDYLNFMEISKWKNEINVVKSNQFTSKHQLPYYGRFDADSIREQLHQQAEKIYPEVDCPFRKTIKASIDRLFQSSSIAETVAVLNETLEFYVTAKNPYLQNWFEIKDDSSPTGGADSLFRLTVDPESDSITVSWCKVFGDNFLFAVSQILQIIRDAERNWTFVEFLAFHVAYFKLSQGATVEGSTRARFIGTPGFRTYTQTYMSLTDPGDGHVNGTTRKNKWMNGAIVHVEHLERPNNLPRTMIESYRIPSILDFAKVRLHVGPAAPTTVSYRKYFVGRALKDGGEFEHDLIKVINTVSAAATAAFALGSAECKVAMCNLTTSDMVTYMRGLAGHVLRNAGRQYLSCAWNLNTEIVDDLPPHSRKQPKILKNRMEIGRRAIEVAALGGFDKVTWDGASDTCKFFNSPLLAVIRSISHLALC
ncbi:hypothetical protein BC936DRAFT_136607 [Jimgerdemannia flammicorona]|uniref:Uncharacterized protein n=1 Tax=Jimgerdemannia flammicorona TaxID=994334 RepID=A0A433CZ61_9FUNG|nr:hypothetical protein BC936DRAFT_136607 [Jimgerdemannia flammicorona]